MIRYLSSKMSVNLPRAADVTEELSRLRPPRFLHPDGIVRPYIRYQADGDCLLKVSCVVLFSLSVIEFVY
jgi:vacuolar protein sorting-associated protein 13A/C